MQSVNSVLDEIEDDEEIEYAEDYDAEMQVDEAFSDMTSDAAGEAANGASAQESAGGASSMHSGSVGGSNASSPRVGAGANVRDPTMHFRTFPRRIPESDTASEAERTNASAASGLARSLPDFDDQHLGHGVSAQAPVLRQEVDSHSAWIDISCVEPFTPLRSFRLNLPIQLFRQDAQSFSDWADQSKSGFQRAAAHAAIASLFSAGVSKGIISGNHIELQAEDPVETSEGTEVKDKPRGVNNVRSYVFKEDGGRPTPMFLYAIEELTSADGELLALGVWKHVFDPSHSDTLLMSKIIAENASVENSIRASKVPALARKQSLQKEAKQLAQLGSLSTHAGLYYARVTSPSDLLHMLRLVAGNKDGPRRSHFDGSRLPHDTLSSPLHMHPTLGGTHTLSPEYCFNAKRAHALSAGLVDIHTGKLLPVQDAQLEPTTYFRDSVFRTDVASRFNMSIMADPYVTSIFDLRLPRPLIDSMASPGPSLIAAFEDIHGGLHTPLAAAQPMDVEGESESLAQARKMAEDRKRVARFLRYVTQSDDCSMQSGGTYDILDPAVASAKRASMGEDYKPTATPLDELVAHTNRIRDTIVVKWRDNKKKEASSMPPSERDAEMRRIAETFVTMTHELTEYHLQRIRVAFICREKRATIPYGYVAWYDSLVGEVEYNGGSASLAFGDANIQMLSTDRSPLGELMGWIGGIYTDLCFVDGRQRSAMDLIYFTVFECFQDVTYYTILSGAKGLGKSLRTDRLAAIFPAETFVSAGSSSKRSGMNGTTNRNARVHVYDEMPPDMLDSRDTMRQDFYKTIATKRFYVHERTEKALASENGLETMKSVANETDHKETHVINTNHGVAFTDERSQDPDDSRSAFVDRSVFEVVRNARVGAARTDPEFHANLALPGTQQRLHAFRMFTSLVAAAMTAMKGVPFLGASIAHANAVFDRMDAMLTKRFSLPAISPRKKMRRQQTLTTLCVMDAVARVYMFKQTALDHSVGRPTADGGAPAFSIEHIGEVIRNVVARPETILLAWSYGLDLSVATHPAGSAAMTALCAAHGLSPSYMLMKESTSAPCDISPGPKGQMGTPSSSHGKAVAQGFSTMGVVQRELLANADVPLDRSEVHAYANKLSEIRVARAKYREMCSSGKSARMSSVGRFLDATVDDPAKILPTQNEIAMFHADEALYSWCQDRVSPAGYGPFAVRYYDLTFAEVCGNRASRESGGDTEEPKQYDFSMLNNPKATSYKVLAMQVFSKASRFCDSAGLTVSALRDLLWMLGSSDNNRLVASVPDLDGAYCDQVAQTDAGGAYLASGAGFGRGCKVNKPLDCRNVDLAKLSLTDSLHKLVISNRIPTVQCVASNKVRWRPPLSVGPDGSSFAVNIALDHITLLAEASTALVGYPGYSKAEHVFADSREYTRSDNGLSFDIHGMPKKIPPTPVENIPFSMDILGIFLTKHAAELLHDDVADNVAAVFNATFPGVGKSKLEFTSRYPGVDDAVRLLSFQSKQRGSRDKDDDFSYVDDELNEDQVSERMGRPVTAEEVEEFNRGKRGSRGSSIKGNPCLYSKFVTYNTQCMVEKGFVADSSAAQVKTLADSNMLRSRAVELMASRGEVCDLLPSVENVKLHPVKPTCFRNIPTTVTGKKRNAGSSSSEYSFEISAI